MPIRHVRDDDDGPLDPVEKQRREERRRIQAAVFNDLVAAQARRLAREDPGDPNAPVQPIPEPNDRWGRLVNMGDVDPQPVRFGAGLDDFDVKFAQLKKAGPAPVFSPLTDDLKNLIEKLGYDDFLNNNGIIGIDKSKGLFSGTVITLNVNGTVLRLLKENGEDRFRFLSDIKGVTFTGVPRHVMMPELVKVRLKSVEESSKVFGYAASKKKMFKNGALFSINELIPKFKCKKDGKIRDCVTIKNELDKALKFVLSDLELVYPDIKRMVKGYTPPKDWSIKKGTEVRIVRKIKGNPITKGTVGVVKKVENIGAIPYYSIDIGNGTLLKVKFGKIRKI